MAHYHKSELSVVVEISVGNFNVYICFRQFNIQKRLHPYPFRNMFAVFFVRAVFKLF